ncbi:MAG: class I SAM-dependent methyltransferase [Anaerolineae bacterium]|nr:class I SAM-dependent methyltransferase [Anaerolineae bacterium]
MTAWYEESFGSEYLRLYAHRDLAEACANIRAIEALLSPPKDEPLLDLCCGAGRYLVALWRAGFRRLVGLDLSEDLLQVAAKELRRAGVPQVCLVSGEAVGDDAPDAERVLLVREDMRRIPYRDIFATVISIFTSFGYFETDEDNRAVLVAVQRALRPEGTFLLDYLNRDHVITHLVPEDERLLPDCRVHNHRWITDDGLRVEKLVTMTPERGEPRQFRESVRMYSQREMREMLISAGFAAVRAYGSLAGEPYGPDSPRLVLVAQARS